MFLRRILLLDEVTSGVCDFLPHVLLLQVDLAPSLTALLLVK